MEQALINIINESCKSADEILNGLKRGSIAHEEGLTLLDHCRNTIYAAYDMRIEMAMKEKYSEGSINQIMSAKEFRIKDLDAAVNIYMESRKQNSDVAKQFK